jgi:branched-chain amino acid transport system substrate-binding protein
VKIGLLVPDKGAISARNGAELAISKVNKNGGYYGKPFELVVRFTDGPWGTGSKESVNLVFKDEVLAIMGSLDGRNAHLAEQVAAKTKIVFLSSRATDMTLSQAFVPWYFRCVPNDRQQALLLAHEIYDKRKIKYLMCIALDNYDAGNALKVFIKTIGSMNVPVPEQVLVKSSDQNHQRIIDELVNSKNEAVLIFGNLTFASDIISGIKQQQWDQAIFGNLAILDDQRANNPDWSIFEKLVLVSPGFWFTKEGIAFQKDFKKKYGYEAALSAAYAYDGINILINAIKSAGTDRDKIIEAVAKTNYKTSVTGQIQFDENGNRSGNAGLMFFRNGKPFVMEDE